MSRWFLVLILALAVAPLAFGADDAPPSSKAAKKAQKRAAKSKKSAPAAPATPASPNAAVEPTGPVFALKGARILTAAGPIYDPGVLIVADGKILDVGAVGKVTVPKGARVVDVAGKVLIPGLVDTH